jgi:hypothetical protein
MWILHLLPDSLILFFTYCLIGAGVIGLLTSWFITFIPFLNIYRRWIQLASILLLVSGIYWYGGYSNEMLWRERVAEMEAKVAAAEEKSRETNKEIETKIVEKTKVIREKGKTQIEYINRLVEGKTVEIVKDMSAEERAAFEAKQQELLNAIKNCPVPRVIIEEQNKAAAQK